MPSISAPLARLANVVRRPPPEAEVDDLDLALLSLLAVDARQSQLGLARKLEAAARAVGCGPPRVIRRHVLPVLTSEIIIVVSSAIGWTTLLAATLDFLGSGIRPPTPDWGADLAAGVQYLGQAWWISAAPGIAITILLANYVGDFLAGMADPDWLTRRRSIVKDTTALMAGDE
jgi:ABC-type antimicrobial peptide transport system permease subunit